MRNDITSPDHPLLRTLDRLAHLLPAQGPISIFIHHNTLHVFEHLSFEDAVEHAAMRLEREPYLAESRYRDKLASGAFAPGMSKHCSSSNWARPRRKTSRTSHRGSISGV